MKGDKIIIPVASGKGGVGKSMLVSNLGIALAARGYRTTVVDLDLGGSNLHTCLGLPNRYPGVGDFLKGDGASQRLSQYLLQTPWNNLSFLPGDGRTPFMANIPARQRKQLLDQLGQLPGEIILLDLGAGSALNTLGFFGMVHRGLLVTSFETPAIMNLLSFLKNFSYWIITVVAQHDDAVYQKLTQAFRATMEMNPVTVNTLLREVEQLNPQMARTIKERLQQYTPRIVSNMGDRVEDLQVTEQITRAMQHGLSLSPEYFGFIRYDGAVRRSMVEERALTACAPTSSAALDVDRLAERLSKFWQRSIPESAAMLQRSTETMLQS